MKKKQFSRSLSLKKVTVSRLQNEELQGMKGGYHPSDEQASRCCSANIWHCYTQYVYPCETNWCTVPDMCDLI